MYTGRRRDPATKLQLHRNRYYHAALGQWLNRDPLGYVDGMSQYRAYFVPGKVDPLGLVCSDEEDLNEKIRRFEERVAALPESLREEYERRRQGRLRVRQALREREYELQNAKYRPRLIGGEFIDNAVTELGKDIGQFDYPLSWRLTGSTTHGWASGTLNANVIASDTHLIATAYNRNAKIQNPITNFGGRYIKSDNDLFRKVICEITCSDEGKINLTCHEDSSAGEKDGFWAAGYRLTLHSKTDGDLVMSASATSGFALGGAGVTVSATAGVVGAEVTIPDSQISASAKAVMGLRTWRCVKN